MEPAKQYPSTYLKNMNRLQEIQQKVNFYEFGNKYEKGVDAFVEYIEFIRDMDQPITLISQYIRFAKFCLMHNDILFAQDLYKEAQILLDDYQETIDMPEEETISPLSTGMSKHLL